ncbi:fructosamine kinase family protein [uncultured Paraglaciecola sp.]|uniref:fructosamine kinase family protein n=1 Tax=uncultured Paraglaciecola sp. TaxID=1765024 RepID=UPI0026328FE7|nr:fructosamine kinase family protein [uncultured Paraglaciecola sp.]
MWHFISEQISECIQQDFNYDDILQIKVGDGHHAFKMSSKDQAFFVKTNKKIYLPNFAAEAEGLTHLSSTQLFKVPKVICTGMVSDHSFLVLEHIPINEGDEQSWYSFGQALANLHKVHTQAMYGWQEDNYIGLTPQANTWQKKWSVFFAEQRIGFVLQLLAEKGHSLGNIDNVVTSVKTLLASHHPTSSMLHGDLWQGNTGFFNEQPLLYDPAFYFGDRETDLAMTELFGRFPDSFYQGYDDTWPIDQGYQFRKPIYQLYHILNHALLFGGQYIDSAKITLKNLDTT